MATEAGHIQISEFSRDVIPSINWMMEDLFCQYGVSLPWFMLDFDFPDYSQRPEWLEPTFLNQWPTQWSGYNFNLDWGPWGYWLPWFNELLGLAFDEAHLPRLTLSDLSLPSVTMFNEYMNILYDNVQRHYVYGQSGTFTKDEVVEGETSGITGYYKWKDGDGYIHVANKSAADFEDEKIVGADSGAYAWTYELYPYYTTYTYTPVDPDQVRKIGTATQDGTSCVDAWTEYLGNPSYDTHYWSTQGIVGLYCTLRPGDIYMAQAPNYYPKFNTSSADASPTSAVFRFYIKTDGYIDHGGLGSSVTVRVYQHDWETLDTGDWTGGTLEGAVVVGNDDEASWIEVSVDTSRVNIGGWSKYRMALKEAEDGDIPSPNGWSGVAIHITSAQLKLGYNE